MVRFLIITIFWAEYIVEGSAYSDLSINGAALIRGRHLFETHCVLGGIWYYNFNFTKQSQCSSFHVCWKSTENILLHSLTSYKCKYIMIQKQPSATVLKMIFLKENNLWKHLWSSFLFSKSLSLQFFKGNSWKYFVRNIKTIVFNNNL